MKRKFSTADVIAAERVDYWRSCLSNEFQPVLIQDYEREGFFVDCEFSSINQLEVTKFYGSRQAFVRSQAMAKTYHGDHYVIVISGPGNFEHGETNSLCAQGDVILFDASRPYLISHDTHTEVTSVTIPRQILDARLNESDAACGLKLVGESGAAKIIKDYVTSLARNADKLDAALAHRCSLVAVDLIAAGFAEMLALDAPLGARRGARIVQTRAFIENNLTKPDLDHPMIAAAMGLSTRRLYEIFSHEEMTVADYIWEARLRRAHRLIGDDLHGNTPIASIAHQAGFASAAHFARRFKAQFGCTPSEFRERLRRGSSG